MLTRQVTIWTVYMYMYITMQRSKLCLIQVYSLPGESKHVVKVNVIKTKFHSLMIQQCLSKLCRYLTVNYVPVRTMIPFKQLSHTGYYKAIMKQPEFDRTVYKYVEVFQTPVKYHLLAYLQKPTIKACMQRSRREILCIYGMYSRLRD